MHLLVLSAFRHTDWYCQCSDFTCLNAPFGAQCFPTIPNPAAGVAYIVSQCTFWCSVLSDGETLYAGDSQFPVSMHLLVLSAFRLES